MNYKIILFIATSCGVSNLFPATQTPRVPKTQTSRENLVPETKTPREKRAQVILALKESPEFKKRVTKMTKTIKELKEQQAREDLVDFAEETEALTQARDAALAAKNKALAAKNTDEAAKNNEEVTRLNAELENLTLRSNEEDYVEIDKSFSLNTKIALALFTQEQKSKQEGKSFNEQEAVTKLLEINQESIDYENAREQEAKAYNAALLAGETQPKILAPEVFNTLVEEQEAIGIYPEDDAFAKAYKKLLRNPDKTDDAEKKEKAENLKEISKRHYDLCKAEDLKAYEAFKTELDKLKAIKPRPKNYKKLYKNIYNEYHTIITKNFRNYANNSLAEYETTYPNNPEKSQALQNYITQQQTTKIEKQYETRLAYARQLAEEKAATKAQEKEDEENAPIKLTLSQSMSSPEIKTILVRATSEESKKKFNAYLPKTQEDIDAAKKAAADAKEEYKEPVQKTKAERDALVKSLKFENHMAFLLMEKEQAFKAANPPLTAAEEEAGEVRKSFDFQAELKPIIDAHKKLYDRENEREQGQQEGKRILTSILDARRDHNKRMNLHKMNKSHIKKHCHELKKVQKKEKKRIAALAKKPETKELFERWSKLSQEDQKEARKTLTPEQNKVLGILELEARTIYFDNKDKALDEAGWEPDQLPKPTEPKRVYENFLFETIKHPLENKRKALAFIGIPGITGMILYNYKKYEKRCITSGITPLPMKKYYFKLLKTPNPISIAVYGFIALQLGFGIKDFMHSTETVKANGK